MEPLLRKHWTSLLGVLFVLAAFFTLFKYSVEQGWITDVIKIGIGLLSGSGLCVAGLETTRRNRPQSVNQIVIGLGSCVLYATISFAGIYYGLWTPMTVLIGMTAITAGISLYAYRFDSRLLMNIALAGGLMSPLFMQPETDQVFSLFIYAFIINAAFFSISIAKGWTEIRVLAFVGTWLVYATYFVHFNPPVEGLWSMPLRYAVAAFVFYLIGFMIASWKSKRCFDGLSVYISFCNAIVFGCWAVYILRDDVHYSGVLALIGVIYLGTGCIMIRMVGKLDSASVSHGIGGLLLLLLASSQLGNGMDAKPLVNVILWGGLAGVLAVAGHAKRWISVTLASVAIWAVVGVYWFVVTWDSPRGEWFGTFIPFLNWGAMAWVLLAAIGFYFSARGIVVKGSEDAEYALSMLFALLSHAIVGGLLTVQIQNVFHLYFDKESDQLLQLSLSISWGVYALLLVLWGAYRDQLPFRWFGSFVLILVAVKAIFMDLHGEEALYKVFVLLVLGGISFLISWINAKWKVKSDDEAAVAREQ